MTQTITAKNKKKLSRASSRFQLKQWKFLLAM